MQCKYCGFGIGEEDHRCQRCGRRLSGVVIAAPPGYKGANALAAAVAPNPDTLDTQEFLLAREQRSFAAAASAGSQTAETPAQSALFTNPPAAPPPPRKVIQFDRWQRQQAPVRPNPSTPPVASPAIKNPVAAPGRTRQRVAGKYTAGRSTVEQATLDFIPEPRSKTRQLKTTAEAQIYCDQPVATTTHRFIASAIDVAMILIGFGLIVTIVQLAGGSFGTGRQFWMTLAAAFGLVTLFYGLVWAIAGRETVGMRSTDLQLITFDGFPVDARSRALRFVSTWLSFCSGGLGLLWAMGDEESLTWHDHISKTFPTIREVPRSFVKQRR